MGSPRIDGPWFIYICIRSHPMVLSFLNKFSCGLISIPKSTNLVPSARNSPSFLIGRHTNNSTVGFCWKIWLYQLSYPWVATFPSYVLHSKVDDRVVASFREPTWNSHDGTMSGQHPVVLSFRIPPSMPSFGSPRTPLAECPLAVSPKRYLVSKMALKMKVS